jgi:hypothetical protein
MFHWRKEIVRLDIPASQVFHLERSLSAVQVALPGLPAQEATAYLCLFAVEKGLRVALVLHLHTSQCLAFYLHERADAPQQEAARLIEVGHNFAESLGFTLSVVDYRKLGQQQRASLWGALPLKNGVEPSAAPPADESGSEVVEGQAAETPLPVRAAAEPAEPAPSKASVSAIPIHNTLPDGGPAMRVRAPKQPLRAEELTARRQKLLESLGRFLASL